MSSVYVNAVFVYIRSNGVFVCENVCECEWDNYKL